jgi:glutaredoxin 3
MAMVPAVTMYVGSFCPYCDRARALLKQKGVEFTEINVEDDPATRAEMMERSGRRTVPQIFVGDHHVGGSDDLRELDRSGGLDALLKAPAG